jgi:hypothetical protein
MANYNQLLIFIFLTACHDSPSPKTINEKRNDSAVTIIQSKMPTESLQDTARFFNNCENIITFSYTGYLQGVKASKDSLGKFHFFECYDCKETFKMIFISKKFNAANSESIEKDYQNSCKNKFSDFNCFVFVYPMRDPDSQKDVHALNMNFPLTVKVFEHIKNDHWEFKKKVIVNNFAEFAHLEFNSIYHLQ